MSSITHIVELIESKIDLIEIKIEIMEGIDTTSFSIEKLNTFNDSLRKLIIKKFEMHNEIVRLVASEKAASERYAAFERENAFKRSVVEIIESFISVYLVVVEIIESFISVHLSVVEIIGSFISFIISYFI